MTNEEKLERMNKGLIGVYIVDPFVKYVSKLGINWFRWAWCFIASMFINNIVFAFCVLIGHFIGSPQHLSSAVLGANTFIIAYILYCGRFSWDRDESYNRTKRHNSYK